MRVARPKSIKRPTPLHRRLSKNRRQPLTPISLRTPIRAPAPAQRQIQIQTQSQTPITATEKPANPTGATDIRPVSIDAASIPPATITPPPPAGGTPSLSDGLAICLFGFSRTMHDSEYEEEVRERAIMSEVLPDEVMWAAWAKNEAPLRQGRGWYPALDRHFLELLVISEIHCLSHPMHLTQNQATAERIHRHASRVRRVACERIGAERLHAYCERVKEAFEAYVHGGWGGAPASARFVVGSEGEVESESEDGEGEDGDDDDGNERDVVDGREEEGMQVKEREGRGRGRSKTRGMGSIVRTESPKERVAMAAATSPTRNSPTDPFADPKAGKMDVALPDSVSSHLDVDLESDLLTVDLDDVNEDDESLVASDKTDDGMDLDLEPSSRGSVRFPTAGQIVQAHTKASSVNMSGGLPLTA